MCGIFGFIVDKGARFEPDFYRNSLTTLARLSESRGKDSSGLVFRNEADRQLQVLKGAVPLNYLLGRTEVARQFDSMLAGPSDRDAGHAHVFAVMGHSRLVTNGSHQSDDNNQPVVKDGIVGIHNGIIVNEDELWSRRQGMKREYQIDTEVMLALVKQYLNEGEGVAAAVSRTVTDIFGTVAAAFFFDNQNTFALATNNGSLYVLTGGEQVFAFASEGYFLEQLAEKMQFKGRFDFTIRQIKAGHGVLLDLDDFSMLGFSFEQEAAAPRAPKQKGESYRISMQSVNDGRHRHELILDPAKIAAHPKALTEAKHLQYNIDRISALRRCSKCLLPETFPYIEYDDKGVCNYCKNYKIKNNPKPIEELFKLVEPYRRAKGAYDCIIPYSGGRDSTHTLHMVKKVLGLNPIAFTYDWGMVNDLARRNIARVCGKLGVENIIVSADITWKRENIRKNIAAWLKKPNLGMVPLFMAGDKFFFWYADQVKKQTGIDLNIWGINPLENTDFKVGFLGVQPDHDKKRIYSLSASRKAKLMLSMAQNYLTNPAYLNRSVLDTIGSFVSRSVVPHRDYYHMYDYYRWDEEEIEDLVLGEYQWEMAIDTKTTWRIGDGTAPFYNYIYYTVAGFSEYDTFRSNQIREGALSREEGLRLINEENRPRYASLKWYLDIVNLDWESTIRTINAIPKLY